MCVIIRKKDICGWMDTDKYKDTVTKAIYLNRIISRWIGVYVDKNGNI